MDRGTHEEKHASPREHYHPTPLEGVNGPLPDLRVADIVLVRHRRGFLRYLLRQVTGSYWDHSAMIIFARNPEKGYNSNILAEAVQHGAFDSTRRGVEVHKLEEYLNHPKRFDIGIKRFEAASEEMRDRVRSFMLMNIDAPYYRLPLADLFFAWISKSIRKQVLKRQRFSCSGLVQKAFYNAANWGERDLYAFRELGDSPIELQELVTPGDIAMSDACGWLWNKH